MLSGEQMDWVDAGQSLWSDPEAGAFYGSMAAQLVCETVRAIGEEAATDDTTARGWWCPAYLTWREWWRLNPRGVEGRNPWFRMKDGRRPQHLKAPTAPGGAR